MVAAARVQVRPGVARGRKVRTPQGSVPDNVRDFSVKAERRPVQQKANRQPQRKQGKVRVKGWGKSPPR